MADTISSTTNSCDDPRTTLVEMCTVLRRPKGVTPIGPAGGGGTGGGGHMPNPEELMAQALEHVWDALSDQISTLRAENRGMQEKMDAMQRSFAGELAAARQVGARQR